MLACWGDNDGNKLGLRNGITVCGEVGDPPFCFRTPDGVKILITHQLELLRGFTGEFDVIIYAHTHKPQIERDRHGRLLINPGETSGWSFRKPSIAILETKPLDARLIYLPEMPPPQWQETRGERYPNRAPASANDEPPMDQAD